MPINHIKTSTIADGTNTNLVLPSDWNSVHAYTLVDGVSLIGTNTSGVLTNISSGTLYLAGGNNITLSQNANSVTISQMPGYQKRFENIKGALMNQSMTLNGASISHAVAFELENPLSVSYIRIPVRMTNTSTTISSALASMQASACMYSTWNAVVYSLNNSNSLESVASGSNGWTFMNSISVDTNGTRASYTLGFSGNALGQGTTLTKTYTSNNTRYDFFSSAFTAFSGGRFLDIAFNNSLNVGQYWLIFGYSSSSGTNSTRISQATGCNIRYTNHYGFSHLNSAFGLMGSTNLTASGLMGCGSFSTAGGGTTNILPISAVCSSASNVRPFFQMLGN